MRAKRVKQAYQRRGGRWLFVTAFVVLFVVSSDGAEVLFPSPLHLTRRIEDPLAEAPIEVDEYCAGNRVVTVRGSRVIIVDYEKQQITEVDHGAATYSVTPFQEIARAAPPPVRRQMQRTAAAPRSLGLRRGEAGRPIERFEIVSDSVSIELGVDHETRLSPGARDVLLGGAYPASPTPLHDQLLAAAGSGLPAEQRTTFRFEGRELVVRNVVTRVGNELVSPDLIAIPAGAKRVESRFTATAKLAAEIDHR